MMEATAADEDDEDGTGKVVNVAQLYQTLMLLSGGANGSVASTVARIVQAHGVSPLVQLVRQSAALFLAADAETQALFTSATAGEGDASALAALLERYNPLLEQANAPGASVFDADEDAGLGAAQHADGAISSAAGADEDAGNDAFHDAEDDGQAFRMHELVYAGDVDGLRAYILQFGGSEIHMLDARGNTVRVRVRVRAAAGRARARPAAECSARPSACPLSPSPSCSRSPRTLPCCATRCPRCSCCSRLATT